MDKQKVKIEYLERQVFFCDQAYRTAMGQASDFVKRNEDKFEMNIFVLNETPFFDKWKFVSKRGVTK